MYVQLCDVFGIVCGNNYNYVLMTLVSHHSFPIAVKSLDSGKNSPKVYLLLVKYCSLLDNLIPTVRYTKSCFSIVKLSGFLSLFGLLEQNIHKCNTCQRTEKDLSENREKDGSFLGGTKLHQGRSKAMRHVEARKGTSKLYTQSGCSKTS